MNKNKKESVWKHYMYSKSFIEIFPALNTCLGWTYSWVNMRFICLYFILTLCMYIFVYNMYFQTARLVSTSFFCLFFCSWLNIFFFVLKYKTSGIWELCFLLLTLDKKNENEMFVFPKAGCLAALFPTLVEILRKDLFRLENEDIFYYHLGDSYLNNYLNTASMLSINVPLALIIPFRCQTHQYSKHYFADIKLAAISGLKTTTTNCQTHTEEPQGVRESR